LVKRVTSELWLPGWPKEGDKPVLHVYKELPKETKLLHITMYYTYLFRWFFMILHSFSAPPEKSQ